MIKKTCITNKEKGFTLLEMTIVLAILTALVGVAGVRIVEVVRIKSAEKTAREMKVIQDAAKAYYVDNSAWPGAISDLKSGGYIANDWTTDNPFGNAYNIATAGSTFQVSTDLSTNYHGTISLNLPSVTISGDTATSTIPIPGSESSSASIPSGAILIFNGAACPAGYTRVAALDNYFIMGSDTYGATGGNSTHTHTGSTGSSSSGAHDFWGNSTNDNDPQASYHPHTHSFTTPAANHLPPYTTVLFCQKD